MLRLHSHMLEFPLMKVLLESLNTISCCCHDIDIECIPVNAIVFLPIGYEQFHRGLACGCVSRWHLEAGIWRRIRL
jgi:hypothetical protein